MLMLYLVALLRPLGPPDISLKFECLKNSCLRMEELEAAGVLSGESPMSTEPECEWPPWPLPPPPVTLDIRDPRLTMREATYCWWKED